MIDKEKIKLGKKNPKMCLLVGRFGLLFWRLEGNSLRNWEGLLQLVKAQLKPFTILADALNTSHGALTYPARCPECWSLAMGD